MRTDPENGVENSWMTTKSIPIKPTKIAVIINCAGRFSTPKIKQNATIAKAPTTSANQSTGGTAGTVAINRARRAS